MSSYLRSSQCYVTQRVRISPDTNTWSMFKPSLQKWNITERCESDTFLICQHQSISQKSDPDYSCISSFPIILTITANSWYLHAWLFLLWAGSPPCSSRRACKASFADTKKILWFASFCVHAFNSVTRNSTAFSMCCARTYKNMFKHSYLPTETSKMRNLL